MVTAQLRRHRPISCGMRLAGKGVRCSASAPSGRQRGEPEIDSSAAHHARGIVDCELRHTPLKNVELDCNERGYIGPKREGGNALGGSLARSATRHAAGKG